MKLLIDTHVLLWWLDDPAILSKAARDAITDSANDVLVSAAVVWEIVIKTGLGKLAIPPDFEKAVQQCGFRYLPVHAAHALAIRNLPTHHRDPFDRMLVAQAIVEGATLVTRDANIFQYAVTCVRA
jgi:PIN domain nuclease of toxin-antitoxin system